MKKKRIFRLKPCDEVNNIWLLQEKIWWIFYSHVSAGNRQELIGWVERNNGVLKV